MKTPLWFLIGSLIPTWLHGQSAPPTMPSSLLLQSGIVLGTERERHFSLRMEALGRDFSGLIEDQITDLYRNPAFFNRIDKPVVFGELVRPRYTYLSAQNVPYDIVLDPSSRLDFSSVPFLVRGSYPNRSSATGLRVSYGSRLGVLLRGNYGSKTSRSRGSTEGLGYGTWPSSSTDDWSQENRDSWGEAQLSFGFPISEASSVGLSYTLGTNDNLAFSRSARTSTTSLSDLSGYDSTYQNSQLFWKDEVNGISNTGRLGVVWDKRQGVSWDAVATIEFFSATIRQEVDESRETYSVIRQTGSSTPRVYRNTSLLDRSMSGNVDAVNLRLNVRHLRTFNDGGTFAVQLGAGIAHFSSDDDYSSRESRISYREEPLDTTESSSSSRLDRFGPPEGVGFQVEGGLGWTFRWRHFLGAIALLGDFRKLDYDYAARRQTLVTLTTKTPDTTITSGLSEGPRYWQHERSISMHRIAFPLGVEYELVRAFHVRASWVVEFLGGANQDISDEVAFRTASRRLEFSTVTFGIGYQIFDRLRADLVNFGNLTQSRDWDLSVILNF